MVIETNPTLVEDVPAVLVFSDAQDNVAAIREIDEWAHSHGFLRTREYHLNTLLRDSRRLYQGFCYRPTEEHAKAAEDYLEGVRQRREAMPLTTSSAELLREDD